MVRKWTIELFFVFSRLQETIEHNLSIYILKISTIQLIITCMSFSHALISISFFDILVSLKYMDGHV